MQTHDTTAECRDEKTRAQFARMACDLAARLPFYMGWCSLSQYGYVMSDGHATEAEAEAETLAYYRERQHLL